MTTRVLVAGIGNIFLADDGFGCEVVRHLESLAGLPGVRVEDYGIRGMHLAYDLLEHWDLAVIVDALPDRGNPGRIEVMEVRPADDGPGWLDTHSMDPVAVLASVTALGGELPRTCVVGAQLVDITDRIGLSDLATAAIRPAASAVGELVREHLQLVRACRPEKVG